MVVQTKTRIYCNQPLFQHDTSFGAMIDKFECDMCGTRDYDKFLPLCHNQPLITAGKCVCKRGDY